jgi:ABC-2 type transport system ATP-binding protein
VGTVEDLLAEHRVLVGPRADHDAIAGVAAVIRASHTDRQSTLVVRTAGTIDDPLWTVHDVTLEDLVLAYLADAGVRAGRTAWEVAA